MRVVMFTTYPGLPWEVDWAKAAATSAEVARVSEVRELTWPAAAGSRYLARDPDDPLHYQLRLARWRPSRVLGRLARQVNARRYEAAVRRVARDRGPVDVLHGHFYWSAYLPRLGRRLGLPYVLTEHHTAWQGHWSVPAPTPLGLRRARRLYANAACVVAVCESLRQRLLGFGMQGNFQVIPNPVDTAAFPAPVAAPPSGAVEVVSVGRLSPAKGFDVLLPAFAEAHQCDPRLRLTVVGDGGDRGALRELRSRLGLEQAVNFTGSLSRAEIGALLQRAHLFALASRAENLTVAVIEALASGLPVVVTDVGGHPELVDEELGRLVPSEDPSAFAKALLEVVASLDSFDRAGIAARTRERYSVERVGGELAAVYAAARSRDRNTKRL